jgi:hypothetical protein
LVTAGKAFLADGGGSQMIGTPGMHVVEAGLVAAAWGHVGRTGLA